MIPYHGLENCHPRLRRLADITLTSPANTYQSSASQSQPSMRLPFTQIFTSTSFWACVGKCIALLIALVCFIDIMHQMA